jgi:hypothetical protein
MMMMVIHSDTTPERPADFNPALNFWKLIALGMDNEKGSLHSVLLVLE